jgi:hypothetical protein
MAGPSDPKKKPERPSVAARVAKAVVKKTVSRKAQARDKRVGRGSLAAKLIGAHAKQLERQIEVHGVAGLAPLYRDAKAELVARLARLGGKSKPSQAEIQAMIRQAEAVIQTLGERQGGVLKGVSSRVVEMGVEQAAEEYRQMSRRISGTTPVLDLERGSQLRGLVRDVDSSLLRRHSIQIGTWTQNAVLGMEQNLSVGFMSGKPVYSMIEDLMAENGLMASERYKAERIVRTEGSFSHGTARFNAIRRARDELGDEKMQKRLVETFDDRTGDDSFLLHGQTVPVDQPFTYKFKSQGSWMVKLYQHPPNRPNDRAVVIAWDPTWSETDIDRALTIPELLVAPPTRWRATPGVKIPPGHRPGRPYR